VLEIKMERGDEFEGLIPASQEITHILEKLLEDSVAQE